MTERNEPADVTRDDCLHLLGAGGLGRVVFTASAMPAVQPVSYVLHGDEVLFRVANGGSLSTATRHSVVGFQVDDIDPVTHVGWSVLGVGQAYAISDTDGRAAPTPTAPGWAIETASHTVAVSLQQLTGHRIELSDATAQFGDFPAAGARP